MSEYLPQDVMMKILSRLPPKILITFRLVSKSWNFMISTPHFIKLHTQQTLLSNPNSPKTNQMLMRRYSKPLDIEVYSVHIDDNDEFPVHDDINIEYPFRDDIRFYYRVVGSCNGVLCLSDDQFGQSRGIYLWNPVIMRRLKLPAPETSFMLENDDPGTCMVAVGFGFDAHSHDYKVVRISYVLGDCEYHLPPTVEVYALSKRCWHTVEGKIPNSCVPEHFWSQAFINGNVHWVAYRLIGKNNKLENLMMVFDVTLEVFDEMPLPEAIENELSLNLGALDFQGTLAVVQYDERVWSTSCSIWVMKRYGDLSSWSKDYTISLGGAIGIVLGVRRNGDVLLSTRFGGLLSYNTAAERYKDLGIFGTKDSYYVGPYHESLVLLTEGELARERLPSESEDDSGSEIDMECDQCEYSTEHDDDEQEESKLDNVEKCEYWMQCSMYQYLTALLRRPYI